MRIYINQEERNFILNFLYECIEDFMADQQFSEEYREEPEEIEVINSLFKKLSNDEEKTSTKIRYVYEKIQ
ncbi:MAG: hypothetical protein ABIH87_03320 [bacterium]